MEGDLLGADPVHEAGGRTEMRERGSPQQPGGNALSQL